MFTPFPLQAGGNEESGKGEGINRAAADALATARGQRVVHCCGWAQCKVVCETQDAMSAHVMREHITAMALQCAWVGCSSAPFPSRNRLARHFNETHLGAARQEVPMAVAASILSPPSTPRKEPTVVHVEKRVPTQAFLSRAYLEYLSSPAAATPALPAAKVSASPMAAHPAANDQARYRDGVAAWVARMQEDVSVLEEVLALCEADASEAGATPGEATVEAMVVG